MAIAFDAASNDRGSGVASLTTAHTCTGSNRALVVCVVGEPSPDVVTDVTYAGVSMTKVGGSQGSSRWMHLWYLNAPASGTNNIVVTGTGSGSFLEMAAASYTGVSQTGQPEANATNSSAGATSLTTSVTTTTDNAWVVLAAKGEAGTIAAGASTTLRTSNLIGAILDSNGDVTPAGSRSLIHSHASSASMVGVAVALAPSGSSSGGGGPLTGGLTRQTLIQGRLVA